jgi:enoyl-CoA hydratase
MIELTQSGDIAIVKLVHGKANALDIEFCDAIAAQFAALRDAPAKAVVLTGQGRMFSAGVDLLKLSEGGAPYVRRFLPALHRLYDEVFFFPKPLVAAVNGHAIAGGCVLACCADKRIAAREGGRIGVTELLVGVPFPAMAFEVMRFATPPAFFAETLLSGATYLPDVAQARRMVDELAEADGLLPRAIEAATTLAALSPQAFATTKQQLRQDARDRLAREGAHTDKAVTEIWTSDATLAFIRDYVARALKKT